MNNKKVGLVKVWLGKIPDYFQFHIETIGSITAVDFHFFTDDKEYDFSKISHSNFHLHYINKHEFLERYNKIGKTNISEIQNPKKIIDFKLLYFEIMYLRTIVRTRLNVFHT